MNVYKMFLIHIAIYLQIGRVKSWWTKNTWILQNFSCWQLNMKQIKQNSYKPVVFIISHGISWCKISFKKFYFLWPVIFYILDAFKLADAWLALLMFRKLELEKFGQ